MYILHEVFIRRQRTRFTEVLPCEGSYGALQTSPGMVLVERLHFCHSYLKINETKIIDGGLETCKPIRLSLLFETVGSFACAHWRSCMCGCSTDTLFIIGQVGDEKKNRAVYQLCQPKYSGWGKCQWAFFFLSTTCWDTRSFLE